jgi:hypothetical protein
MRQGAGATTTGGLGAGTTTAPIGGRVVATAPFGPAQPAPRMPRAQTTASALEAIDSSTIAAPKVERSVFMVVSTVGWRKGRLRA